MAGCTILPDPCETPEPDPPTQEETTNSNVVRQFIERVWNYGWTAADNDAFLAARRHRNRAYVPDSIANALNELRSPATIRHRRDRQGNPVQSSGTKDYATCVNAVHEVAQDLRLEVVDLVAKGDHVVAHIAVEGLDQRADGCTDKPGAFGAPRPTGERFRTQATMYYRVCDQSGVPMICEDWLLSEPYLNKAQAA